MLFFNNQDPAIEFSRAKCYATKSKALLHTVNFHYWQLLDHFYKLYFFYFPQALSDSKNSLPKYKQKLILWLKNKTKQTNKTQSNIMILLQQIGKLKCLCNSVICLNSAFTLPFLYLKLQTAF